MKPDQINITIPFPKPLYEKIQVEAVREERSISAQVRKILTNYYTEREEEK